MREQFAFNKYLGLDTFFFITVLCVSIACAVMESQISRMGIASLTGYNRGAFGAAAVQII